MIEYIPELIKAGITSFKIEGRVKNELYVATVVKAYRKAIDQYFENGENYKFDESILDELSKVSHREYTTGFFFGKPDGGQQIYTSSSYVRNYDLVGLIEGYDKEKGLLEVSQRNKFFVGDEVEILTPHGPFKTMKVEKMYNEKYEEINDCPHATMKFYIPSDEEYPSGSFIRKARIW